MAQICTSIQALQGPEILEFSHHLAAGIRKGMLRFQGRDKQNRF